MNKGLLSLVGFLLFIFGFISLILMIAGLKLTFLSFIDVPGPLFGFLVRICMIFVGIIIVYMVRLPRDPELFEDTVE